MPDAGGLRVSSARQEYRSRSGVGPFSDGSAVTAVRSRCLRRAGSKQAPASAFMHDVVGRSANEGGVLGERLSGGSDADHPSHRGNRLPMPRSRAVLAAVSRTGPSTRTGSTYTVGRQYGSQPAVGSQLVLARNTSKRETGCQRGRVVSTTNTTRTRPEPAFAPAGRLRPVRHPPTAHDSLSGQYGVAKGGNGRYSSTRLKRHISR